MEVYDMGVRLRKLREDKGLSQTDAGKRIGVSRSTMNGYESNTQTPPVDNLRKLVLLYGTTADYILGLSEQSYFKFRDLSEKESNAVLNAVDILAVGFHAE